jgi:hypothetical protein
MVGFLLGHGLNNGVGQRRKTSSIATRLADLENSALVAFPAKHSSYPLSQEALSRGFWRCAPTNFWWGWLANQAAREAAR